MTESGSRSMRCRHVCGASWIQECTIYQRVACRQTPESLESYRNNSVA